MGNIKIKPCKGFRVKKPDGDFLKEAGETVEQGTYWARRLKFGEVELVADIKEAEVKKEEVKKEEPKKLFKREDKKQKSKGEK